MDIRIKAHRRNMSALTGPKSTVDDCYSSHHGDAPRVRRSPLKHVFREKKQQRSNSAPARMGRKHLLVEDHYRVDPVDKRLLPGLPVSDEDEARDMHDFFNLVALVSLC